MSNLKTIESRKRHAMPRGVKDVSDLKANLRPNISSVKEMKVALRVVNASELWPRELTLKQRLIDIRINTNYILNVNWESLPQRNI